MSFENQSSPYATLDSLRIADQLLENELSDLRNEIINVHELDDKIERERLMAPIRARCVSIHNQRIAISVAKNKALKDIALLDDYVKYIQALRPDPFAFYPISRAMIEEDEDIVNFLKREPRDTSSPSPQWERLKKRMNEIPGIRNVSITVRMPTENEAMASRVLTGATPGLYPVRDEGYLVMDLLKSRANGNN